jgi:hypothetical protein
VQLLYLHRRLHQGAYSESVYGNFTWSKENNVHNAHDQPLTMISESSVSALSIGLSHYM